MLGPASILLEGISSVMGQISGLQFSRSVDGPLVVAVTPTYNERGNIEDLVTQMMALDGPYGLLIVDDNSPDGTGELADELANRYPGRVRVLHRPGKLGYGKAYVDGFKVALESDADLIGTMDADFSHKPSDLARLVSAVWDGGYDLALGSRYQEGAVIRGWTVRRRLISRLGGYYARAVLGLGLTDPTAGFKVYRRALLEAIDLDSLESDGYGFNIETTYRAIRAGGRVVELPYDFYDRAHGVSKFSRRIIVEAMVVTLRLRLETWHQPLARLRGLLGRQVTSPN